MARAINYNRRRKAVKTKNENPRRPARGRRLAHVRDNITGYSPRRGRPAKSAANDYATRCPCSRRMNGPGLPTATAAAWDRPGLRRRRAASTIAAIAAPRSPATTSRSRSCPSGPGWPGSSTAAAAVGAAGCGARAAALCDRAYAGGCKSSRPARGRRCISSRRSGNHRPGTRLYNRQRSSRYTDRAGRTNGNYDRNAAGKAD